ncbi:MAG: hypothetical protein R3E84_04620 [Pseudomonadales bacterium]
MVLGHRSHTLLELRLREEGYGTSSQSLCVPEPTPRDTTGMLASTVVLEYFPSLRSPYTAIGHQRNGPGGTQRRHTRLRPVMLMMMRGVLAPRAKQQHIIMDAGREARYRQVPFGQIVDPFGEPVKKPLHSMPVPWHSVKKWPLSLPHLRAAWTDGVDIATDKGLQTVAANAGINWQALADAS